MANHPHCAVRACEQDQVSRFCVIEGNFMRHICKLYRRAWNVDMEMVKYIGYKTGTIETLVWISRSIFIRNSDKRFSKRNDLLRSDLVGVDEI